MPQWDDDAAKRLMSSERRLMENPTTILDELGIREGMSVADLGCGSGYFTIPIAMRVGNEGIVYAVDSSPSMLSHLRQNIGSSGVGPERVKIIEADLVRTGIPDKSVDVAFFANVLHDIGYIEGFLAEVRRILKPGGAAVDLDWNKSWKESGPPMQIRIEKDTARKLLESNGLVTMKAINIGTHHYILICSADG